MIYSENIFVCLAAPLLIAVFLLEGDTRRFIGFFLLGLTACLLAGYCNGYIEQSAIGNGLGETQFVIQFAPVCEEILKALPVFFYMAVFEPKRRGIVSCALAVGLGFATQENVGYIAYYGAGELPFALVRGFSAGIMHAICAAILGYGLSFVYRRRWLEITGSFAVICAAATFHATYNLLVSAHGAWRGLGYILPVVAAAVILFFVRQAGKATSGRRE